MGLGTSALSISRFRIIGLPKAPKTNAVSEALASFRSKPIRLEGVHKEDLFGWVRPEGLDDLVHGEREHWDGTDCEALDGYVLRMRHERRKVPPSLLLAVFQEKLRQLKKGGEKISKRDRDEVKRNIKNELLGQSLPTLNYVDGFWDLGTSELLIFTTSKKKRQLFESLFAKCFLETDGAVLVPIQPPLIGADPSLWQATETSSVATEDWFARLGMTIPSGLVGKAMAEASH